MVGTFVNVAAIIIGSLIGGFFKRLMNEKMNMALMDAMGIAALGIGINSIVQNMPKSEYPVLCIVSLALGCVIGTIIRLDARVQNLSAKAGDDGKLGQGLTTGCLIFCIGTMSILGPVQAALYGDYTLLFTNATLDLVTSMVLASSYGVGMVFAAGVLLIWQGTIYALTLFVGPFITESLMTELAITGGFLIAMSGLSISKIKTIRTLDYLPSLLIPVFWCMIVSLF